MKYVWRLIAVLALLLTLPTCSTTSPQEEKSEGEGENQAIESSEPQGHEVTVSKDFYRHLYQTVFEVVIPKTDDKFVQYEKPLPKDKLPYRERVDKYYRIGTAFTVQKGRYISAAHLFNLEYKSYSNDYFIRDSKGKVYKIKKFLRYSNDLDLCEFDLEKNPPSNERLKVAANYEIGDEILSVGNAYGEGISIRGGQISSFTPEEVNGRWNFIRFSAPASPGNSGGPLITKKGEVVGIIARKTQNENLNFAIPFEEVKKLSTKKADFSMKGGETTWEEKTQKFEWNFQPKLPATPTQLANVAQKNLFISRRNALLSLRKKYKNDFFPYSQDLKKFVPFQSYYPMIGVIDRDEQKKWVLHLGEYKKSEVGPSQYVLFQSNMGKNDLYANVMAVVQKPKNMPLKKFVEDPKGVMDTFLKGVGWNRKYAGEEIKVISYGKPHKRRQFKDFWGRGWSHWKWNLPENEMTLDSYCTPVPNGMACTVWYMPVRLESFALQDSIVLGFSTYMLSYVGTAKEWTEFQALGPAFVPQILRTSRVASEGSKITLSSPSFDINYQRQEKFNGDSRMYLYVGLLHASEPRLEVQGFGFVERTDRATAEEFFVVHRPPKDSSEGKLKAWEEMANRESPYNGRSYTEKDNHMYFWITNRQERSPAQAKGPLNRNEDRLFAFQCKDDVAQDQKLLEPRCRRFIDSVRIK